jgi:hypothetical protein
MNKYSIKFADITVAKMTTMTVTRIFASAEIIWKLPDKNWVREMKRLTSNPILGDVNNVLYTRGYCSLEGTVKYGKEQWWNNE